MASRFWLGGTGNWDGTTASSAHWGTASGGGTTPTTGPGVNDTATFDANSGGGTVTVTGTITVQSITCGAFTGTLDFSANNNNVTLTDTTGFSGTGTGTRTINLGNGTWTFTNTLTTTFWNLATTTNLTFNANSSTIVLSGTSSNTRTFAGGGLTYNNLTYNANTTMAVQNITGANTFAALTINAPNFIVFPALTTTTVTSLVATGTSSALICIEPNSQSAAATISDTTGTNALDWCGLRSMTFSGGATFTATNSFDLGRNTGITITVPATGGGGGQVLGGGAGVIA